MTWPAIPCNISVLALTQGVTSDTILGAVSASWLLPCGILSTLVLNPGPMVVILEAKRLAFTASMDAATERPRHVIAVVCPPWVVHFAARSWLYLLTCPVLHTIWRGAVPFRRRALTRRARRLPSQLKLRLKPLSLQVSAKRFNNFMCTTSLHVLHPK